MRSIGIKGNLDSLPREIGRLLAEAEARDVLRAVLVIARDSLEAVAKGLTNPDNLRIAAIVGADVIGALMDSARSSRESLEEVVGATLRLAEGFALRGLIDESAGRRGRGSRVNSDLLDLAYDL